MPTVEDLLANLDSGSKEAGSPEPETRSTPSTVEDMMKSHGLELSEPEAPAPSTLAEMGRQLKGGVVSQLPKMAGQAIQAFAPDDSSAENFGKELAAKGAAREAEFVPDVRDKNTAQKALIYGAGSLPATIGTAAAYAIPGIGAVAGPAATLGLYGGSQYQDTKEKVLAAGGTPEEANKAGLMTGATQGLGELVANKLTLGALGAGKKAAAEGVKGLVGQATDTAVVKPFLKNYAKAMVGEPATEVSQDVATNLIENKYGVKTAPLGETTAQSALGAMGMTAILAPFGIGGHVAQAGVAKRIGEALDNPDVPEDHRIAAINGLYSRAKNQGVPDADVWYQGAMQDVAAKAPIRREVTPELEQPVEQANPSNAKDFEDVSGGVTPNPTITVPPGGFGNEDEAPPTPDQVEAHTPEMTDEGKKRITDFVDKGQSHLDAGGVPTTVSTNMRNAAKAAGVYDPKDTPNILFEKLRDFAYPKTEVQKTTETLKATVDKAPDGVFKRATVAAIDNGITQPQIDASVKDTAQPEDVTPVEDVLNYGTDVDPNTGEVLEQPPIEPKSYFNAQGKPFSAYPSAANLAIELSRRNPDTDYAVAPVGDKFIVIETPKTPEAGNAEQINSTSAPNGDGSAQPPESERAGNSAIRGEGVQPEGQENRNLEAPEKIAPTDRRQETRFIPHAEKRVSERRQKARDAGLTDEQILSEIIPDEPTDAVTGFAPAYDKDPTIAKALEHVSATGGTAHFVEADISNLGGLNNHFGDDHSIVNPLFRQMSDIFKEEMQKAGKSAVLIRHGGDELSAVVIGGTDESIDHAMSQAKLRVADFAKAQGLDKIPHPKVGKAAGVGLYLGGSKILPGMSPEDITRVSSEALHAEKKGVKNVRRKPISALGVIAPSRQTRTVGGPVTERPISRPSTGGDIGGETAARLSNSTQARGAAPVDAAAEQAEINKSRVSDTAEQNGGYKKPIVDYQGIRIGLENAAGSERKGTDAQGKSWSVTMVDNYGEIEGTKGADGDKVDAFIKPGMSAEEVDKHNKVFIIDQVKPGTTNFDEHKVILGYDTAAQAKKAYLSNYSKGWQGLGAITAMPMDKFKTWLTKHEDHKIPTNLELREKNAQTPIQENAGDVPRIRNSEAIRKTIAAYSPDGNIGAFWGPGNATLRAKIIQEALGLAKLPAAKRATNTNFREVVLEAAGIPAGEHSQAKEDALFSEWVSGTKPSSVESPKFSRPDRETLGKGSSGEVYREGSEAVKNATNLEGEVYKSLRGVEGIAQGYEKDGFIRVPVYPHVIGVDTIEPDKRKNLRGLVARNESRINAAISALSNRGFYYNDPLQFGMASDKSFDLLDFSAVERTEPEKALRDNLGLLASFYRTFGAEKQASAISQVSDVLDFQRQDAEYQGQGLVNGIFEGVNYDDLTARLGGQQARYAYYSTNARHVQLKDIAQTDNIQGVTVVLSVNPLSEAQQKEWELVKVAELPEQSKFSRQDSDLESLFEKLSSRSPKATREAALASIATLPQAERIQYVEDHFLDLLSELEETNKVDIKC